MNSLSYISRQFDVLAAPRAPPSTPVSERPPRIPNVLVSPAPADDVTFKRVKTWSRPLARALDAAVPGARPSSAFSPGLRRSVSSPANAIYSIPSSSSSPSSLKLISPRPRSVSVPVDDLRVPPSDPRAAPVLRRMFFVRVLVIVWKSLCDTWAAWTGADRRHPSLKPKEPPAMEAGETTDEKDSEDESSADEKAALLRKPVLTLLHPNPDIPTKPALDRTISEPPVPEASAPATPVPTQPPARKLPPFHQPKTLVLDLDETLIHSTTRPMPHLSSTGSGLLSLIGLGRKNEGGGRVVEVVLNGRSTLYHVYKRPFVDYFLRKVSGWYTLVVFTASMREYADPVIDWLDAGTGILNRRLFRESCTQINGQYAKDLSLVEQDLSRVCLLDNSPVCYSLNEANGIPIEGWTHDPLDEALLDLLPVLDSLRFTSDVRRVLGIRGFA